MLTNQSLSKRKNIFLDYFCYFFFNCYLLRQCTFISRMGADKRRVSCRNCKRQSWQDSGNQLIFFFSVWIQGILTFLSLGIIFNYQNAQFLCALRHKKSGSLLLILQIFFKYGPLSNFLKSEKVCGVCFSVTQKMRKKCRNLNIKSFATKVRKSLKQRSQTCVWHSQILGSFEAKNITCVVLHENLNYINTCHSFTKL